MNIQGYLPTWNRFYDLRESFFVGLPTDSPQEAAIREDYDIVEVDTSGRCLARDEEERLILVCECNGPTAVHVGE